MGVRLTACVLLAGCIAATGWAPASARTRRTREFRSPSGAIVCVVEASGGIQDATCENALTRAHHLKHECGSGSAIVVDRTGRARYVELCGVIAVHPRKLAYGHSITVGRMRCRSARSGVTCRSLASGHGFKLSRHHLRRF